MRQSRVLYFRLFGGTETLMSMSAPVSVWRRTTKWRFLGFASDACGNIIYRGSYKGSGTFAWDVLETGSGHSYAVHWRAAALQKKETDIQLWDPKMRTGTRSLWLKLTFGTMGCLAALVVGEEYQRFKGWLNPPAREGLWRLEESVTMGPRRTIASVVPQEVMDSVSAPLQEARSVAAATLGYSSTERSASHPRIVSPSPAENSISGDSGAERGFSWKTVVLTCATAAALWIL